MKYLHTCECGQRIYISIYGLKNINNVNVKGTCEWCKKILEVKFQ
jgi:hypothetical protein